MCQVFKLHTTEPDAKNFKESLLECLLNGICDPEDDNHDSLKQKIRYSILWKCTDSLQDVLKNTGLDKEGKKEVLRHSLVNAIACNNVSAVKALFEDTCVSVDIFDVRLRLRKTKDILDTEETDLQHF